MGRSEFLKGSQGTLGRGTKTISPGFPSASLAAPSQSPSRALPLAILLILIFLGFYSVPLLLTPSSLALRSLGHFHGSAALIC